MIKAKSKTKVGDLDQEALAVMTAAEVLKFWKRKTEKIIVSF